MTELRKDYFGEKFVIMNSGRSGRPVEIKPPVTRSSTRCALCAGITDKGKPAVVVDQKSRLISSKRPSDLKDDEMLSHLIPVGRHLIVAITNHDDKVQTLKVQKLSQILSILQETARSLSSRKGGGYTATFLNYGVGYGDDGAISSFHPNFEILTLPIIPPAIEYEINAVEKSMYDLGICPICRVLSLETGGPRQILSTTHFLAFAPWAATHPFEFWITPKTHQTSFLEISDKEIYDLALILRSTLGGLTRAVGDVPFTVVFHNSPQGDKDLELHWHLEAYPLVSIRAGLEEGMSVFLNDTTPELAAETLGRASRKELAALVGVV